MKKKALSFVLTLKLNPEIYQEHVLEKRLNSGRQLYNILLGKCLNIQKKLKASPEYQQLILTYKLSKTLIEKELQAKFNQLNHQYGFTEYDLHALSTIYRKQFVKDIDSNTAQKIATRVFKAVSKYHYRRGGKPRFKGYGKLKSLEGKSNASGIRFEDGLIWGKLKIPAILKDGDAVQDYSLTKKIKYVRILKKNIRGKAKYFVQLILAGKAYSKFEAATGRIGIDLGPQTIAYVGAKAGIKVLAEKVTKIIKDKKKIQQKLARKLRLLNPDAFEKDFVKGKKKKLGKIKKGSKCKNFSKSYKKLRGKLSEIERKQLELRKESHGALINELL